MTRSAPPPRCRKCRHVPPPDARTCNHCGASLGRPSSRPEPTQTLDHYLVTSAGEAVLLEPGKVFTLGRLSTADLVARSSDVSRRHAQILWAEGSPMLQDLDASQGTFIDDRRLEPHSVTPLEHGQRLRLANNTVFFYFHIAPHRLLAEIKVYGIGGLTQKWVLADLEKRTGTRKFKAPSKLTTRTSLASLDSEPPPPPPPPPPKTLVPTRGNLASISGAKLLLMLSQKCFSGRVDFFDGVQRGQIEFVNGNAYQSVMGDVTGEAVVKVLACLEQGTFRVEGDVPRTGSLRRISPDDLLCEYYEAGATGVLSFSREDDPSSLTGRLVFIGGIACSAGYGKLCGSKALEKVGQLKEGLFVFEDKPREELDGRMQSIVGQRETIRLKRTPRRKADDD